MSDVDLPLSRQLPWGLLALALLLPVALAFRDARQLASGTAAEAKADALGDFGAVPNFLLTERSGREITCADLAGAPWIADFVYTSCMGACPLLSGGMSRLHHRLADRVRLVSFTVDPARDSPQVLAASADRFGASPTSWLFVTGPLGTMRQLISEGFHLAVADPAAGDPQLARLITHSEKVVLIDADLRIRRYYDAGSGEWPDAAITDLAKLRAGPSNVAR